MCWILQFRSSLFALLISFWKSFALVYLADGLLFVPVFVENHNPFLVWLLNFLIILVHLFNELQNIYGYCTRSVVRRDN